MKNLFELANDRPQLSKRDLLAISRAHDQPHDSKVLKKDGLQQMAKMEDWGVP